VKKAWLVVALTALGGLAANTFADVQNIRLSGDIRVRGYLLDDAGISGGGIQDGDASFISQRTRVCVEADLEDHVLVVVTLSAEGLWGQSDESAASSGAGGFDRVNRRWDLGVNEAYVQLNELFYSPATLKLGRQYLHYGRGLILSSVDQEYNYDAGRLVFDFYPFTLDLVGAQLVNNQSFAANPSNAGSADLLFVNGKYEMNVDNAKVNLEAYYGWIAQGSSGKITTPRVPPTAAGASPMLVGARADIGLPGVNLYAEGAYEFGNGGATPHSISAWLLNAGVVVASKEAKMSPSFNANYTYAGGGGKAGRHGFVPWFDYVDGYNGYLFAPMLSNLHIFNIGGAVKPAENLSLGLQAYYYLKVDGDSAVGSNPNVDFGGLGFSGNDNLSSRDVGWELDFIAGYDYSKDVRLQLVYGMFFPLNAYSNEATPTQVSSVAHLIRGELTVKF
jgi:hypothetical protein